jgi:hypothetical protein
MAVPASSSTSIGDSHAPKGATIRSWERWCDPVTFA